MENLIKRYFWAINLVVLATIAYLSARVVNNLLAGVIAALPTHPKLEAEIEKPSARRETGAANTQEWATTITERNLFNSEPVAPETADAGPSVAQLPDHVPDEKDPNCRKSDGPLGLLATMVAAPREWSMAIVNDGSPDSRIVKEGQLLGDYTVSAIYRQRMVVARSGQYECVELGQQGQKGVAGSTGASSFTATTPSAPEPAGGGKESSAEGIQKTGEYSYKIERDWMNKQLEDIEKLSRQARVIPHYRDGKPQGFKLVGVRPGSVYSHLGIRSGDVLKAVNGDEITSPNKALEMYEKLKSQNNVTIEVERRGRPISLDFNIQ
jgi:general secretion pathway protein C